MEIATTPHIEVRLEKCGGKPCIQGTRIRIHDIYIWHVLGGQSAIDILSDYPDLSLASIHAAISYAFDHREQIEQEVAAENAQYEQLKLNATSKVASKLRATDVSNQVSS